MSLAKKLSTVTSVNDLMQLFSVRKSADDTIHSRPHSTSVCMRAMLVCAVTAISSIKAIYSDWAVPPAYDTLDETYR